MTTSYKVYAPGEAPSKYTPGDFILVKTKDTFSMFIRFGQALRYHGVMKQFSYWNHCALIVDADGTMIEVIGRGVVENNISEYEGFEYYYVSTNLNQQSRDQVVAAAKSFLNDKYAWLTIVSISLNLALGVKLQFTRRNTMTCSAVVAQSLWAGGIIFNNNPYQMMPADLAVAFNVSYTFALAA